MMVSHTRALVACPGGFGTCDELFEIMTLVQTGKHPRIPIVLFGKSYWSQVINWEKMAEFVSIGSLFHPLLFTQMIVGSAATHSAPLRGYALHIRTVWGSSKISRKLMA